MRLLRAGVVAAAAVLAASGDPRPANGGGQAVTGGPQLARDYPVRPVPFTAVHLDDEFWRPRIETNRTETIPFAFEMCEQTGRVGNFVRAAKALRGEPLDDTKPPGYPFDDTDVYKVIEGASYSLSVHPDAALEALVDGLIAKIAAAQERDGYLYTTRSINPSSPHPWAGTTRWELERDDSHELYNLGHLYQAAVAHYRATAKRTLLDVAIRSANLLVDTFGPGKQSIWPGHQITEMALADLYRVTGDGRYLALARFLLDERGPRPGEKTNPRGLTYNQAHQRVVEQTEATGHAVRATYMYSGMADVAALTGDQAYLAASNAIWDDVVRRKLYVTGGIGATGKGEAFGGPYELPNMTAYSETCAAIGNDYWNHRLFLLHADAKYIDVLERALYNGLISGVSLDGKTFFYTNPLESNGQHARRPWFGVACCPGNITRFLASVPGYVYAVQGDTLYVNLFAQGTADVELAGGRRVVVTQRTRYPWDGEVVLRIDPSVAGRFTVRLRIPGWARNEPVPSDLYRFVDEQAVGPEVAVNGRVVAPTLERGYAVLKRDWTAGDVVRLSLPMPVRRLVAHDAVDADRGRVALQRGPIVFAAEWPDNPGGRVRNIVLPEGASLQSEFRPALLDGLQVVTGTVQGLSYDAEGNVRKARQPFTAIPYYAWANRGRGQMIVWLPTTDALAKPAPWPTLATTSKVSASTGQEVYGVNDAEAPLASSDSTSAFSFWPRRGTTEWIEYAFEKQATVSAADVYWFDDTGHGQVRVPSSWRVLYQDGEEWKPVEAREPYGVRLDGYNRVSFVPVTTSKLRLEITAQPRFSTGVQEWSVRP